MPSKESLISRAVVGGKQTPAGEGSSGAGALPVRLCKGCKYEHPPLMLCQVAARLRATNAATNKDSATNALTRAATNAAQVKLSPKENEDDRVRSVSRGEGRGTQEPISSSAKAVVEMGRNGAHGVQRGLQRHVEKPGTVFAPEAGEVVKVALENDGLERRMDSGECGAARTLNRRSKEAYNAYQREYMRKRRQAGSGEVTPAAAGRSGPPTFDAAKLPEAGRSAH